jgi:predicted metal-dependent hydrolase
LEETSQGHLVRGARLFDRGAYFEAHEVWENRWRLETDETCRRFFQGLIQVAAGFHKLVVVGSGESAVRLLTKGLAKLDACPTSLVGPEIAAFRHRVRAYVEALEAGGLSCAELPRVQMRIDAGMRTSQGVPTEQGLRADGGLVSGPLPIASFKLNFVAPRVRIVPRLDPSGRPFRGPGIDLVGVEAATAIARAQPVMAWLQAREQVELRTLSLDIGRARLLVTVEAAPRPRVIHIDPQIDLRGSTEILECAAPLLRHLGSVARDKLVVRLHLRPPSESPQESTGDAEQRRRNADIDESSAQSFPASDPPSSTAVHAGLPSRLEGGRGGNDR